MCRWCTGVTDSGFVTVVEACSQLEYVAITGKYVNIVIGLFCSDIGDRLWNWKACCQL